MSEAHTTEHDDGSHESLIKTPTQLIWTVVAAFVVPVVLIILLVNFVVSADKPGAGSSSLDAEAVARRIMPVGMVELRDGASATALRMGEQVYTAQCAACHAAGVAGAPKLGDAAAWGPRITAGYEGVDLESDTYGYSMAAQGGGDLSDPEIGRAVVYMANGGGAKFEEPKAPQPPASAPQ